MKKKRGYLTATMPDGYVKTIGPTTDSFTHYWRIVAELDNGKTEVFWGHARSLAEARRKRAPADEAKTDAGMEELCLRNRRTGRNTGLTACCQLNHSSQRCCSRQPRE